MPDIDTPDPSQYQYEFFNVTFPAQFVAHVEINRPEKRNAFHEVMWTNLSALITALSASPHIRAILLSGAGASFSAGLDIVAALQDPLLFPSADSSSAGPTDAAHRALALQHHITCFQAAISSLSASSVPVIVALHGTAYGLALDIALAADIRIASACARMSVREVDIGIAADIGVLSRLGYAVGNGSWVRDVCLTAREFGAEEAERVGLVSEVLSGKEAVVARGVEIGRKIAEKSPVAVRGTKEILNYSMGRTVEDGLRYTAVWNGAMLQGEDVQEAIGAVRGKRKAKFAKL